MWSTYLIDYDQNYANFTSTEVKRIFLLWLIKTSSIPKIKL